MSGPDRGPRMGAAEWAMLGVLALLWGGSFVFAEVALRDLPPLSVVLGRVGLAALVLHAIVLASGARMPPLGAAWGPFLLMGLLNNAIPFALIVWGQTRIGAGLASILNATTPLFTVLVAHALTRDEKLSGHRIGGVLLGLAGVAVTIGPAALGGLGGNIAAQLAVLGAALSYAFAGIFGRRFRGLPPAVPAAGQVTGSTLLLLPLVALVDRPWRLDAPGAAALGAVVGLAVLCTAVAYVLYFRILAAAGATNLLLVTFLVPVGALLLGAALLGERVEPRHLAGMALILAGLTSIDGRAPALLRRRLPDRVGTAKSGRSALDAPAGRARR